MSIYMWNGVFVAQRLSVAVLTLVSFSVTATNKSDYTGTQTDGAALLLEPKENRNLYLVGICSGFRSTEDPSASSRRATLRRKINTLNPNSDEKTHTADPQHLSENGG